MIHYFMDSYSFLIYTIIACSACGTAFIFVNIFLKKDNIYYILISAFINAFLLILLILNHFDNFFPYVSRAAADKRYESLKEEIEWNSNAINYEIFLGIIAVVLLIYPLIRIYVHKERQLKSIAENPGAAEN